MNVINHSNNKVALVLKCKNTIGESCFWDPRDNQLWWTDIEEKKIWSLNENGHSKVFNLPDRAGFILPRKEPGFIIGFPKNISIANQDLTSFTKIQEVETQIKEKGHLKDIPSASEVAANGIYLGEMDSKLLQKIEELTLYTIQQQKEIERLKLIEKRLFKIEKFLESKK